MLETLFNKVAGLKACNFIKKESPTQSCKFVKKGLQYRCFSVKFAKFSRTPILKNTSSDCFCQTHTSFSGKSDTNFLGDLP